MLLLVLAAFGTLALRTLRLAELERHGEAQREAVAREALEHIEADFAARQDALLRRAERLTTNAGLVSELRAYRRSTAPDDRAALTARFAELETAAPFSAELYDETPRLLAWSGPSVPPDDVPSLPFFLDGPQTGVVAQDRARAALALWLPVRDGARVLGAVRVLEIVRFDPPLRNQYLSETSLERTWRRATHLPVNVVLGIDAEPDVQASRPRFARTLRGLDGRVLGYAEVEPPSPEQLAGDTRARYADLMALWGALAVLLALVACGTLFAQTRGRSALVQAAAFAGLVAAWWGARFAALAYDVPGRWQDGRTPLAPLFDPTHLASTLGGGALRSTGDLIVTTLVVLGLAWVGLRRVTRETSPARPRALGSLGALDARSAGLRAAALGALALSASLAAAAPLALAARRVLLDSTLTYFTRTALWPEPLVFAVFAALLALTAGALMAAVAAIRLAARVALPEAGASVAVSTGAMLGAAAALVLIYAATPIAGIVPLWSGVSFLIASGLLAWASLRWAASARREALPPDRAGAWGLLTLRATLFAVFIVTLVVYPMLYSGLDAQRRVRMQDAAASFDEGRDPRLPFAAEDALLALERGPAAALLAAPPAPETRRSLDSLAAALVRGSDLAVPGLLESGLVLYDAKGRVRGRFLPDLTLSPAALDSLDAREFVVLRQMVQEGGVGGRLLAPMTGRRATEQLDFVGIQELRHPGSTGSDIVGYAVLRIEPESALQTASTPFPRVLAPAGFYGNLYTDASLAEFRDGVLVRSYRQDFGRYRLDDAVETALAAEPTVWREETVREARYLTYYERRAAEGFGPAGLLGAAPSVVLAVRVASPGAFDHLYYLLRLMLAGILLAAPLYLLGVLVRWRRGALPASRVRFRDKVLNAFLAVGLVTVAGVGYSGRALVLEDTEIAVEGWLRQHLERVEQALQLEARAGELPYQVLGRVRVDSLAARVGLDLNVYQGERLVATSRPTLVQDHLLDTRLPSEAFHALYFDGFRFALTRERLGAFEYQAGYRALYDEAGAPRYVLGLPTLPEQERIQEERARTTAYLFGALLLLVIAVMATAALVAGALSRPMVRLREGLRAAGQGRFEPIPEPRSRDEIAELVATFNAMQGQLEESRRQLTLQERQLAWREMARQVAHEIKNPLTPMKLSVQHLRRAHDALEDPEADTTPRGKFDRLFERVTTTILDQVETLRRIADEFHTFARMPTRVTEPLDLSAVAREAAGLLQEEAGGGITLDLADAPLVILADREELRRAFINLIKNGAQATPEGEDARITVRTFAEDGRARAEVQDEGAGIPEDVQPKIFQPNFSTKTSGTGLGLAIVSKTIQELGGSIRFETTPGEGTTFFLDLPLHEPPTPTG